MGSILVQVADPEWTMQAVHLACAMARNTHSPLVLLHLMEVRNPYLLGAEIGVMPPSRSQLEAIGEYSMIAEDYGLELTVRPMSFISLADALVQAAEHTHASVVFAPVPQSRLPFWRKLHLLNLRRQLTAQGCQLYTLDEPEQTEDWVPTVSMKAAK